MVQNETNKKYRFILPEMIEIEGGNFFIGSEDGHDDEKLVQELKITSFKLAKFPLTVKEYLCFVNATNSNHPKWLEEGSAYNIHTGADEYYKKLGSALFHPDHPIVGISRYNALAYCDWLSEETKQQFRLPSEAEWEYAARGGQKSKGFTYAGSNNLKEVGWFNTNSHGATKPVGLLAPNELDLHDMSGNVFEWCADHWHSNYEGIPKDGSPWLESDKTFQSYVFRGGSWYYNYSSCQVSYRNDPLYHVWNYYIGFRLAGF